MREDSSVTKKFIWDQQNYLAETDENDQVQTIFTQRPDEFGSLIAQRRKVGESWLDEYYHFDALGSTVEVTDSSETTKNASPFVYDGWGTLQASYTFMPAFLFVGQTGYYADDWTVSDSLLNYYVRARPYAPRLGRWLSVDPFGPMSQSRPYSYVGSNPINEIDPSGLRARKFRATYSRGTDIAIQRNYQTAEVAFTIRMSDYWCKTISLQAPGISGEYLIEPNCINDVGVKLRYRATLKNWRIGTSAIQFTKEGPRCSFWRGDDEEEKLILYNISGDEFDKAKPDRFIGAYLESDWMSDDDIECDGGKTDHFNSSNYGIWCQFTTTVAKDIDKWTKEQAIYWKAEVKCCGKRSACVDIRHDRPAIPGSRPANQMLRLVRSNMPCHHEKGATVTPGYNHDEVLALQAMMMLRMGGGFPAF